jgi:hypothetical protein
MGLSSAADFSTSMRDIRVKVTIEKTEIDTKVDFLERKKCTCCQ